MWLLCSVTVYRKLQMSTLSHKHETMPNLVQKIRLDTSDLLIAQLVERQTSIHEVVGVKSHSEVEFFKFKSL